MAYTCYLRGGPEPVGVRTDNRVVIVTEPTKSIEVPVEGGRQGRFRFTEETINIGSGTASVFEFVEII